MLVLLIAGLAFGDVVIGNGTSTGYYPMSTLYNYYRSAALYTAADISANDGPITNLQWYCGTANTTTSIPVKIYMKYTAAAALTGDTWVNLVAGTTQVFNATITANATGWFNFDITDFAYDGDLGNLMVLVESGSAAYVSPYVMWQYTTTGVSGSYKFASNRADGSAPTSLTAGSARPNIKLVGINAAVYPEPTNHVLDFTTGTLTTTSIQLNWTGAVGAQLPAGYLIQAKTAAGTFANVADGTPVANDALWTDGNFAINVAHAVGANTYTLTGLTPNTAYEVKIWPYTNSLTNIDFKTDGTIPTVSGTTLNPLVTTFPYEVDFSTWQPLNWAQYSYLYGGTPATGGSWGQDDWLNVTTPVNEAARINIYTSGQNSWLVTPPIQIPATGYELKFDLALMAWNTVSTPVTAGNQADDKLKIVISDNPNMTNPTTLMEWNNTGSANVFDAIPATGGNYTIDLDAYVGTKYIAFYAESILDDAGDNDLMIDNVIVRQTPAAPIFSLTPTSWDFGQTIINSVKTKQFTIANNGGGTLAINSIGISGSYYTLTSNPAPASLTAGQSATFTVQYAPTAAGTHEGAVTITDGRTVTTVDLAAVCYDPTITSYPYTQNFDGTWAGSPAAPTGWSVINANADSYMWRQANTYIDPTHSEPYAAHGMGNTNDYLITPPVNFSGVNVRLKWWDVVESSSYANSYKVLLSTTDTQISSFTVELADITCINTAWTEHTLNLNAYTGQTVYIAFYQYASGSTYYGFGIDDVLLEEIPSAPVFSISPDTWDFGPQPVNSTVTKQFTVANTGAGTLSLSSVNVTGNYFTMSVAPAVMSLGAGESTTFTVQYAPTAAGTHSGNIAITDTRAVTNVPLSGSAAQMVTMTTGSKTIAVGETWNFYDSGGPSGNYLANENYTYTFYPPAGYRIIVAFNQFATEQDYDYFKAYNGPTAGSTLLGNYHGTLAPFTLNPGNAITFVFTSDTYVQDAGWFAQISLELLPIGPTTEVILGPPGDITLNMPATGFLLNWTTTGGTPASYQVYMSQTESTVLEDVQFNTTETSLNPTTYTGGPTDPIVFNYGETWYWIVRAMNPDNAGGYIDAPRTFTFTIQDDPRVAVFPWTENFETHSDNSLPSGWTRTSNATGWEFGSDLSSSAFSIPSHTVYAAANDDAAGDGVDGSMDILTPPPFNFAGTYPGVPVLSFDSFFTGSYSQSAYLEITTNGTIWSPLYELTSNPAWTNVVVSLDAYDDLPFVQIRFHADDNSEWASGWAVDNVSVIYSTVDNFAPIVDHYPVIGWPYTGDPIVIYAGVADSPVLSSGIASVTLNYTLNGGTSVPVPMTLSGTSYQATIPGQPAGTLVAYSITAIDNAPTPNTTTTPVWDFYINSPLLMQYDSGTETNNVGLNSGTFGIMTGFANPYGVGKACQINNVTGGLSNAGTANVHVYTYDGVTDTFTDLIPSFNYSFTAGTLHTIPLTGCVTTAEYFYVAYTDIVGPNYFKLDQTQTAYPGTHLIHFGAGISTANLGTIEGSGFPGSWLIRAEVQPVAPITTIANVGGNPVITWGAVPGVTNYNVYGSNDPYAIAPWTLLLPNTNLLTYTYTGTEAFQFFKASSIYSAPVRANTVSNSRTANTSKIQTTSPIRKVRLQTTDRK